MHTKLSHSSSFTDKFIDYSTWIINILLYVLVCSIIVYFCLLFVVCLALQACQNTAQPHIKTSNKIYVQVTLPQLDTFSATGKMQNKMRKKNIA